MKKIIIEKCVVDFGTAKKWNTVKTIELEADSENTMFSPFYYYVGEYIRDKYSDDEWMVTFVDEIGEEIAAAVINPSESFVDLLEEFGDSPVTLELRYAEGYSNFCGKSNTKAAYKWLETGSEKLLNRNVSFYEKWSSDNEIEITLY